MNGGGKGNSGDFGHYNLNPFINFSLFLKKIGFFQTVPLPNEMVWCNSFHYSFSPHLKWCSLRLTKSMQRTSRIVETWIQSCLPVMVPATLPHCPKSSEGYKPQSPPTFLIQHLESTYGIKAFPYSTEAPLTNQKKKKKQFRGKESDCLSLSLCLKTRGKLIINHTLNTLKEYLSCGAKQSCRPQGLYKLTGRRMSNWLLPTNYPSFH